MADYDRYDSRTLDRDRSRSSFRNDDRSERGESSIFNFGRNDDRHDRDRDRNIGRDEWRGGRQSEGYGGAGGRGGYSGRGASGLGAGAAETRGSDSSHRNRERGGDNERYYGPDAEREGIARDETGHLIASNKVEGTAVYGRDGERLGDIYNFMVDKRSGHVEYAVMSYGGFLGMGMRYYPLPWDMLTYDTRQGGYRVQLTERDLENAPSFDRNSEPRYDRGYSGRVHDYYGIRY